MNKQSALFTCRDVSFEWEGLTVVQGLNFEIQEGDYLCITGENGSGKSTLIQGLLGIKQPEGGSIIRNRDLKPRSTGYLPQRRSFMNFFPAGVYEVVLSGRIGRLGMKPFYSHADKDAAEKNLERLGISSLRNQCYGELSGGQQQRVLLARAFCAAEQLLVLDEPSAGLDPVVSAEMYDIVEEFNREKGLTVIMVSHDIEKAIGAASHVLHLGNRQLFYGTADEFRNSETGKKFMGKN
ncbi:MAG: metal ABC transporter ATP-binding protein [Treponema sp.]|nr:metal ABC transporter ATP-binding protein [Treponema sp.]